MQLTYALTIILEFGYLPKASEKEAFSQDLLVYLDGQVADAQEVLQILCRMLL